MVVEKCSRLVNNLRQTTPLLVKIQPEVFQTLVMVEILLLVSIVISLFMYNYL